LEALLPNPSTLVDGSVDPRIRYGSTQDPPEIHSKLQEGLKIEKIGRNNDPTIAHLLEESLDFMFAFDNDRNHE
jgi:hypothetical protein